MKSSNWGSLTWILKQGVGCLAGLYFVVWLLHTGTTSDKWTSDCTPDVRIAIAFFNLLFADEYLNPDE